ncbi:MAG TPA: 4-carboxymuconolactone decarboxylase [Candidatus Angelobacter sp.]|nr:4-carboxymuconolactone decarboxylase [Candidatus Angelobacter sp.]
MDDSERYDLGLHTRRGVLGDGYVDRALARRNDFNGEFQDLITRYAWGEIWTRPGLDQRTRRLLVLAMMVALGRQEEFKLHLRAAIEHGVAKDDVKEVLLQAAIYCGVPAANTAFHLAEEVFAASASAKDE